MYLRILLAIFFLFSASPLLAKLKPKTPNDVYGYAILLKQEVAYLRKKSGITDPFPTPLVERNKKPRHVIQKALEILSKINLYRINHGYGAITIPPYPPREITPQDVYDMVKRLDGEMRIFIDDKDFLSKLVSKKYTAKTPSDVYALLWSISMGFDALLGIRGYTPTDVYALSEKAVKIAKFLRHSQNIYDSAAMPPEEDGLHPNHALQESIEFLKKIAEGEKRLWIEPADIPQAPQRVVTPTEVYDSLQYSIAELQRIKYRLGIERYFEITAPKEEKTPSDVVRNLKYAKMLLPDFSLERKIVQYPESSLKKSPNQVFGVTEEILKKLAILKTLRGVQVDPKAPPKIFGLKPIHTYQKGIEAIEKAIRLKVQMGFYPSQIPSAPYRPITPSEVYELIIRLDGIVTLLLKKAGSKDVKAYLYKDDKRTYSGKTPSDVYFNLWRISKLFDLLSGEVYTPNETYTLASQIREKIELLAKELKIKRVSRPSSQKRDGVVPLNVFKLTLLLHERLKAFQKRANMDVSDIKIPREQNVTPNIVYNALRIINAGINEILIEMGIDAEHLDKPLTRAVNKTPSDVYQVVEEAIWMMDALFKDGNY
ncbi:MAG: hypothetical protein L3J42_00430 [Hydrogenimonas sp.]|nr:hypothetical protein [Hydrogenimonas sp.]